MKRVLIAFLALSILMLGAGVVSAQLEQQAPITQTSKVYAAWQPFEKGVMIWWSDLDQIWVLINPTSTTPGQAYIYKDNWDGVSTNATGTPPSGRYAAVRGFGYIWANYLGGGGGQLGWAYSREIGFDSASRTLSGVEMIIGGPGDTEYGVTFAPTNQSSIYYGIGVYRVIDIG